MLYAHECRGVGAMASALRADLRDNGVEWVQLAVPALLYTVQSIMLFRHPHPRHPPPALSPSP